MSAVAFDPRRALPRRYDESWRAPFDDRVRPFLVEGAAVLDVGSGARPAVPPHVRPARLEYAGLDLSPDELAKAPPGSYSETWTRDIVVHVPELVGRFDLVVCWQVLEHVDSVPAALANCRSYLRPNGRLVALVSGTFAAFALVARVVPTRLGALAMHRLLGRDPDTVFRARYDRCWYYALDELLSEWPSHAIVPLYRGAEYFSFSAPLQRAYVRYEEWARTRGHRNLATHYLLVADA